MAAQGIGAAEQQGPIAKQCGGARAIAETLALQRLSRQVHQRPSRYELLDVETAPPKPQSRARLAAVAPEEGTLQPALRSTRPHERQSQQLPAGT
jgi:hypothetical protein